MRVQLICKFERILFQGKEWTKYEKIKVRNE